jgi:uncharacterized OB-fold protein
MGTPKRIPAVEGFFTWPSERPALLASRCLSCGHTSFPAYSTCINPRCKDKRVEKVTLSSTGTLWSYTVHHYKPPPPFVAPEPFVPYGVGVVELPEGLKVVGLLTTTDPKQLQVGAPMQLVIETMNTDAQGTELLTWKFAPAKAVSHA